MRLLLAAGSLAATVGGWAWLAAGETEALIEAPPLAEVASDHLPDSALAPDAGPTLRVVTGLPQSARQSAPVAVTRSSR